jgi:hypothetical protein
MWINMPATFDINDQAILLYGNDSQNGARDGFGPESELHLGLDATEHLRFFTRGTGAAATDIDLAVSSGPALNDDDWHHVAVTWLELQEVVVYIDGSRVASAPFTPRRFASLQNTRIGSPAAVARRFIGLIDEVELSSVRHSDGWIAAHYASMTDPQFVVFGAVDDGLP